MEKRTILAIVLSFLVVLAYQYFFVKPKPPVQQQPLPRRRSRQKQARRNQPKLLPHVYRLPFLHPQNNGR